MEIAILIFSILAVLASVSSVVYAVLRSKKESITKDDIQVMLDQQQEMLTRDVLNGIETSKKSILENISTMSKSFVDGITPYMNSFNVKLDNMVNQNVTSFKDFRTEVTNNLNQMKIDITSSLKEMRESNEKHMKNIQDSNEKKLDEMRKTVDEKLESTLDSRISNAFKVVNDSLSKVQQSFGEMTELSKQVGSLNRVFTNVKVRGGWGEVSLESLLEQILAPEQYERQKRLDKKSAEMVDFAIKMPGKHSDDFVYLPIDSKFPTADYERLIQAGDSGNPEEVALARKELFKRIKDEAKSIKQKYIIPPITTNFAIIYLPIEGLYSEIVKDPELCETLQKQFQVIPCGPTVLAAMLNSLQVGFTTLKIQKSSGEVVDLMKSFKKEFTTFTDLIGKVRKNAQSVVESLDVVDKRNGIIQKKLSKVDSLSIENNEIDLIEGISNNNE